MKAYKVLVKKPDGSLYSARLAWGLEKDYTLLYVEGCSTVPPIGVLFAFDSTLSAEMFGRRIRNVIIKKGLPYGVEIWECKITKSENPYGRISSYLSAELIDEFWALTLPSTYTSKPPPGTICCSTIHPMRRICVLCKIKK